MDRGNRRSRALCAAAELRRCAPARSTNVYGSLLGTVQPNGEINFEFEKLQEKDIPASVASRYGKDFVHWCFAENTQAQVIK